jgi:hypothetical protein
MFTESMETRLSMLVSYQSTSHMMVLAWVREARIMTRERRNRPNLDGRNAAGI